MSFFYSYRLAMIGAMVCCLSSLTQAEVVRFEIDAVEPFADGMSFGKTGAYERIIGRVYFAIDPALPQNRAIRDLDLAPRNAAGKVEFNSDLFILVPKDRTRANGAVLHGVNNRGNMLLLSFFNSAGGDRNNPRTAKEAGNGMLMRHGFTLISHGWDGELLPGNHRLRLRPPIAGPKDKPITGVVRCEMVPTRNVTRLDVNWANHGSYRPTAKGLKNATLTVRQRAADSRQQISRDQWKVRVSDVKSDNPHQLPRVELELPSGMKRGWIYELIYEAQDPMIHGVCFASLRDLMSAVKHGQGRDNPLLVDGKPLINRAHSFGVSQSGRFLREYLYWGFNEDEQGRKALDGVIPHVAGGGLGSFNHRFAQPTRHVAQHDHHEYPADRFPFAYESQLDPLSKQHAGILDRCEKSGTTPMVMHTQSEAEYWTRSGSLVHTDPLGREDAEIPANVRIYTFGGTQHGPAGFPPTKGDGKTLSNPGDYKPLLRALLVALDRWVKDGTEPPPSVYPKFSDKTLVDWRQESSGFPKIPGVEYPQVIQQPSFFDYGPRWLSHGIIDKQPPGVLGHYKVNVPRCDADGNATGCLLPAEVAVPVATYTGWNLRSKQAGAENELVSLRGSYLPFSETRQQREASGDPRLSFQERYGTLEKYLALLRECCKNMEEEGYQLREDSERIISQQSERLSSISKRPDVQFQPATTFGKLPQGFSLGRCSAVDVNSKGEVFLFHRGEHPILCFDADGKYLRSWGDEVIDTAHGLRVDRDDNIWVTDIGGHRVHKFSPNGKLLLSLGSGKAGTGDYQFNKPTDIAFGPRGEIFISDGYGNSRVMKFTPKGRFIKSWGEPGRGDGQFNLPHSIVVDSRGRVLVGDRENDRIQIFDGEGTLLSIWKGFAPYGLAFDSQGKLYVADGRANKVLQLDSKGRVKQAWGSKGKALGQFELPHMLCFDNAGNLYVAEVGGQRLQRFLGK